MPPPEDPDALHYEPLYAPGTIRLLTLYPPENTTTSAGAAAGGTASGWDRIRTSLRTVHLNDAMGKNAYAALSYCRSDPGHTYPIFCNGRTARVDASLFAFLSTVREKLHQEQLQQLSLGASDALSPWGGTGAGAALGETTPTLTLWVDALCINQADPQERSRQASLAPDIFQRAARVLAWLGEADATSHTAVMALVEWSRMRTALGGGVGSGPGSSGLIAGSVAGSAAGVPVSPRLTTRCREHFGHVFRTDAWIRHKTQAVAIFAGRPWFWRAWTFAEAVLAQRCAGPLLLVCGTDRLDFRYFVDAVEVLHRAGFARRVFGADALPAVLALARRCLVRRTPAGFLDSSCLSYLLQFTAQLHAGLARDRLYSLLGIVGTSGPTLAHFVHTFCLPVDYVAPDADVFRRYALLMMIHEKSLRALSHCYRGAPLPVPPFADDLPSWAPDWRLSVPFKPLRRFGMPTDRDGAAGRINIAARECPVLAADPASGCLHVLGLVLDEIKDVYDVYGSLPDPGLRDSLDEGLLGIRDLYNSLGCLPPVATEGGGGGGGGGSGGPAFKGWFGQRHLLLEFLDTLCAGSLPRGMDGSSLLSWEDERDEFPSYFAWEIELGLRDEQKWIPPSFPSPLGAAFPTDDPSSAAAAAAAAGSPSMSSLSETVADAIREAHRAMLGADGRPTLLDKGKKPRLRDKLRSALRGGATHVSEAYLALPEIRARMAAEAARFARGVMRGRAFFVTAEGSMGVGPATARPGDAVVALRGWCLPFVLRPLGPPSQPQSPGSTLSEHVRGHWGYKREFCLLGDAYVHGLEERRGGVGIMDGFRSGREIPLLSPAAEYPGGLQEFVLL